MRKLIRFLLALGISILLSLWLFYQMTNGELLTKVAGFSVLRVDSGSMEPSISVGDILIIKECGNYEVNDVITYNVDNDYLVTHRIIEKKEDNNFVTKGDNNNTKDNDKVTKENIEGKVILNSKLLKFVYKHWFIAIIVVLLILIIL